MNTPREQNTNNTQKQPEHDAKKAPDKHANTATDTKIMPNTKSPVDKTHNQIRSENEASAKPHPAQDTVNPPLHAAKGDDDLMSSSGKKS